MQGTLIKGGIVAGIGVIGAIAAKTDEANWGKCKICECKKCKWDPGSFGGKMFSLGMNNGCAFRRCVCGHHFTQHYRIK